MENQSIPKHFMISGLRAPFNKVQEDVYLVLLCLKMKQQPPSAK
jgi:hypothetical protein